MSDPDTEITRHENDLEKNVTTKTEAPPFDYDFPDGGLQAWLVVVGAFVALFSTFGLINTFGVFQQYYSRPGGLISNKSNSDIAWIGSVQVFFLFAMSCIVGPIFDRVPTYKLMTPGLLLLVLGLFMQSICKPGQFYQFFLSQGVLQGIGIGMFFLPSITSVQHWFFKKRALATGIAIAGSSIGGVLWPITLNRLLNHSTIGYGWTIRIVAFMVLVLGSISLFLCKKRLPPSNVGKKPDTSFIKNPKYLLCLFSFFLVVIGLFIPLFYITEYAIFKKIDPNIAFYLLAIVNAGSLFGRILPGFVADKIGRLNMLIPMVVGTAVLAFSAIGAKSVAGFILVSLLYGFLSGAVISLQPVVLATFIPDTRAIGVGIGISFAFSSVAGLAGSPAAGAILDTSAGFTGVFSFAGTTVAASALLFIIVWFLPDAREPKASN